MLVKNLKQAITVKIFVTSLNFRTRNKRKPCQRIKLKMAGLLLLSPSQKMSVKRIKNSNVYIKVKYIVQI